jgi:hypothetical protein
MDFIERHAGTGCERPVQHVLQKRRERQSIDGFIWMANRKNGFEKFPHLRSSAGGKPKRARKSGS